MSTYEQTTLMAMELGRAHVGQLVQIITETWSMTGTLARVDQHDNREWEIIYPERRLVPSGGEIYAELWIGPWRGQVIGNQPVTVERVKGTLEAPERAALTQPLKGIQPGQIADLFDVPVDLLDAGVIKGDVVHERTWCGVFRCCRERGHPGACEEDDTMLDEPAPADWPDLPGQG